MAQEAVMTNAQFVPLLHHEEDYEIMNEYPFTIRRKKDHSVVNETLRSDGYVVVALNGKTYLKHRLIAKQFIPNPLNLPEVDHIDHDRTNYHLSNLRFVSKSTNGFNKSSNNGVVYEFVDEISDESIRIIHYQLRNRLCVLHEFK